MGGLGPIGDRGRCEESRSSLRIVCLCSISPATLVWVECPSFGFVIKMATSNKEH